MGAAQGNVRRELKDAVETGDFQRAKDFAIQYRLKVDELKYLAYIYNSERERFKTEHFMILLQLCSNTKIELVFNKIVKKCKWRSVAAFIERGVALEQRSWAITQALKIADNHDLEDILPHCTDVQFDEIFELSVERDIWSAVSRLLKREKTGLFLSGKRASDAQFHRALNAAINSQTIKDQDLGSIILSCATQSENMRDTCLTQAVTRGMWITVKDILQLPTGFVLRALCSLWQTRATRMWAMVQVAKRAEESVIMDHFLPLFCSVTQKGDREDLMRELERRNLRRAAAQMPKSQNADNQTPRMISPEGIQLSNLSQDVSSRVAPHNDGASKQTGTDEPLINPFQ